MAAHEIHLQLGELFGRNRNFGKFAEPRRNAVDDFVSADDVFDHCTRAQHPLSRLRCEIDAQPIDCNGVGFIDRESISVDDDSLVHLFFFRAGLAALTFLVAFVLTLLLAFFLTLFIASDRGLFLAGLLIAPDVSRRSTGSQRHPLFPGAISTPPSQRVLVLSVCQSLFPASTSRPSGVRVSSLSTNSRETLLDGATTWLPSFRVTSAFSLSLNLSR